VAVLAQLGLGHGPRVALGATAGVALFGPKFRAGEHRGRVEQAGLGAWQGLVVSTIHPSAVLRAPDQDTRQSAYADFVSGLTIAGQAAAGHPRPLTRPQRPGRDAAAGPPCFFPRPRW
jgi:hypothetical protein